MSDNEFRWVIAAGVGLSSLMTLVMTVAVFAMYRTSKRVEEKVTSVADKATPILDKAKSIVDDAKPKIDDMMEKAAQMTATARDQVARLDALVTETAERARLQIDRVDLLVTDTVDRVHETTLAVQRTTLKPLREVNGVVCGGGAAISAPAPRNRGSADHATQDEAMVIC